MDTVGVIVTSKEFTEKPSVSEGILLTTLCNTNVCWNRLSENEDSTCPLNPYQEDWCPINHQHIVGTQQMAPDITIAFANDLFFAQVQFTLVGSPQPQTKQLDIKSIWQTDFILNK